MGPSPLKNASERVHACLDDIEHVAMLSTFQSKNLCKFKFIMMVLVKSSRTNAMHLLPIQRVGNKRLQERGHKLIQHNTRALDV